MEKIAVWGFRNVPPFAQGLVRDLRVRWALEEAGRAYDSRLIGVDERHANSYRRKHPFGMVPVLESGGESMIESGAIVYSIAEDCDVLCRRIGAPKRFPGCLSRSIRWSRRSIASR